MPPPTAKKKETSLLRFSRPISQSAEATKEEGERDKEKKRKNKHRNDGEEKICGKVTVVSERLFKFGKVDNFFSS